MNQTTYHGTERRERWQQQSDIISLKITCHCEDTVSGFIIRINQRQDFVIDSTSRVEDENKGTVSFSRVNMDHPVTELRLVGGLLYTTCHWAFVNIQRQMYCSFVSPSGHWLIIKTLDTFGNCQRPVFPLGVSQHMHTITNLWEFKLICARSCKIIMTEKRTVSHNTINSSPLLAAKYGLCWQFLWVITNSVQCL